MADSTMAPQGEIAMMKLPADCTVRTVSDLAREACDRLAAGGGLRVDGSAVAQADITFVQLLVSTARSFEEASLPFTIVSLSPAALTAFDRSGIAAPSLSGAQ